MNDSFTVLMTPLPGFSESAVATVLLDRCGIDVKFKPSDSERGQNVGVQSHTGDIFVLTIAISTEAAGVTDLQSASLLYLEESDPDIPVSRVIPVNILVYRKLRSPMVLSKNDFEYMLEILDHVLGCL